MSMEGEIWKDIDGYKGLYQVSNLGRVRSLDRMVNHNYGGVAIKRGKILTPHPNQSNHCQVTLKDGNRIEYPFVHRLVWAAFNGVIPDGMQINHLDENPLNDRLDNLSLVTPKENTNWGTCIERRAKTQSIRMKGKHLYGDNPNSKPVIQYSKDGNLIKEFDSLKSAADYYGITYQTLWQHLIGRTKTCHNSIWKFKRDVV